MNSDPRHESEYSDSRQVDAAYRVLVDVGQVLGSFRDAIVVVGGWVPELLLSGTEPPHIGSIDVDLALDAAKPNDGRYAELLRLLLDTGRYQQGDKPFQLVAEVDLKDGDQPVRVDVDFLASADVTLEKNQPKLVEGFRVLSFPACAAAFRTPITVEVEGSMIRGSKNRVQIQVAGLADLIIMKAHAIEGRDKPKDVYDLCYCLGKYPDGISTLAAVWGRRRKEELVEEAVRILGDKFQSVNHHGPQQLATFHNSADEEERDMHARRAY